MKVSDDRLRKVLGLARMSFHDVNHPIAITDLPLEAEAAAATRDVGIDNFQLLARVALRAVRNIVYGGCIALAITAAAGTQDKNTMGAPIAQGRRSMGVR